MAYDTENDPDVLSMIGASAALIVSDLPFQVRSERCGLVEWMSSLSSFPTMQDLAHSDMDLVVAGHYEEVCMIEGFGKEIPKTTCSKRSSSLIAVFGH